MKNESYADWSIEQINSLFREIFGKYTSYEELDDRDFKENDLSLAESMLSDIGVSVRKSE